MAELVVCRKERAALEWVSMKRKGQDHRTECQIAMVKHKHVKLADLSTCHVASDFSI